MLRKRRQLIFLSALILCLAPLLIAIGCGSGASSSSGTQDSPPRIVSLSPACTEFLYALGAGDSVVGRTDCCDFPPSVLNVPVVGSYAVPNLEKLAAVRPNLIVTNDLQDDRLEEFYRKRGISIYRNDPRSLDEYYQMILDLGTITGHRTESETMAAALRQQIHQVEPLPRSASPLRVLVLVWYQPLCTIGGRTLLADAIRSLGAANVSDELTESYMNISPEQVVHWQPEVIIFPNMGSALAAKEVFLNYPGWSQVPAIKNHRVITDLSSDSVLRPGPRFPDGVQQLSAVLNQVSQAGH